MHPREFLELADSLASNSTPAERRTAVSRAYYAAFHASRDMLSGWNFVFFRRTKNQKGNDHGLVPARLHNNEHKGLKALASELRDLHELRKRADYDLDETEIEDAEYIRKKDILKRAAAALAAVEKYEAEGVDHLAIENMKSWDRRNPDRVPQS